MPKSSASSSALETYGRGQERLYDESQLASSSVANRTREDANEVERLGKSRHVGFCIQRVYTAHKLKLPKPGSSVANTGLRDRGLASSSLNSLKHFSGQCC